MGLAVWCGGCGDGSTIHCVICVVVGGGGNGDDGGG